MTYATAMKYLEAKGIRKPFQLNRRINLKIEELILMLEDYEKFRKNHESLVHHQGSK